MTRRLPWAVILLVLGSVALIPVASAQTQLLEQTMPTILSTTGSSPPPDDPTGNGGPYTIPSATLLVSGDFWSPTVRFTASVSPNVTSVTWNFGDGGTASGPTATHTYAVSGYYSVFSVRALVCTPTACGTFTTSATVVNAPLIVETLLASVGAVIVGLVLANILRHPPSLRRLSSRSYGIRIRRSSRTAPRIHARRMVSLRVVRVPRLRGR